MASTFSTLYSSTTAATSTLLAPQSTMPTPSPFSNLSPSAALGIGIATGVLGTLVLLTFALFLYRCWKVRHSPSVRHYEQTRLWRGFTPVTPTARTTLVESKMADIYFAELKSPGLVVSPGV
jgi:hypothetical protein